MRVRLASGYGCRAATYYYDVAGWIGDGCLGQGREKEAG